MGDAYLQCETLIIAYFLLIFWGIFHYIVLLIVLLWHRAPTLLPQSVFPLLFSCKSREEKKNIGEVGCVAVQCSLEVCCFPDLSWTLTSLGVDVCVCILRFFFCFDCFSFSFVGSECSGLSNYLPFVGVVCVLANSLTNSFNLWFYICEYKVNAYQ